ncbi:MAG: hypothetical protein JW982_07415 [Spirochaetes bacterium]|nr:hypothetical protein [Spirochaetota bacterium]
MNNKSLINKKPFIAKSIFMTHVRRIGWIRTALGGGLMYISFFEFVFIHLTTIIFLYTFMLQPFFKLKKFRLRDYMILDRSKINGMRIFDKFNCDFCGYANGTACIWNHQLDQIAAADIKKANIIKKLIAMLYSICLIIFLFFNFIFSKILFFIIASFLGFHWAETAKIASRLKETDYAGQYSFPFRGIIRFAKLYAESLALNLEQIESGWCPLKHIENGTNVPSAHHKLFFDRDKITEAIETLEKEGSVSDRKPRY